MEFSIYTPLRTLVNISENDTFPSSLYLALLKYSSEVLHLLEDEGFEQIVPAKGDSEIQPQFTAIRDGRKACICFAPITDFSMSVTHLSQEQCDICDSLFPEYDVYYACVYKGNKEEIEFLGPMIVKRAGDWIKDNLLNSQYLPLAMRDGMDRYSSVYNGAVLFKLYQVLLPVIFNRGDAPSFNVKNLFAGLAQGESGYLVFRIFDTPTIVSVVKKSDDDKSLAYTRSLFVNCSGAKSDLELISLPSDAAPEDGQVELMEEQGQTLQAECPEALLYRERMQTGCRYLWYLSMIAERIDPMEHQFSITSGPMFEMERQEYIDEHGCEPPEDFACKITTSGMRIFNQGDGDTYASVVGQVVSIESAAVDCQPMQIVTITPFVDNDEVLLQVFVSPEVMKDFAPKVGETISAAGYVYASASELLLDVPSWQDSPELGEKLQEHDNSLKAYSAYDHLARYSMGHAVALSAFVKAGWELESCNVDDIYTRNGVLTVAAQDGKVMVLCIDTIINGNESSISYDELDDLQQRVKDAYGEDVSCCHCVVRLDCHAKMDRYAVKLEMEPEIPGVRNALIYVASPMRNSILSFDEGEEPVEKKLRPDTLDETMAANLFMEAMAHGKWSALAEWIQEDAEYKSETSAACEHNGKLALLRYFGERVMMWRHHPDSLWKDFTFATGTVLYKGTRRPCSAMYYMGIPTAITIFEGRDGLIGKIHNIPMSYHCFYKQEGPIVQQSLRPDVESVVEESVLRPPHDAVTATVCECSDIPELQEAAQRVFAHLKSINYTPVYCNLTSGKVPHIWFRDSEERLCWAVLYTSDMRECEFRDTLTLGNAIELKKLRFYPGFILPCIQVSDKPAEQIRMLPVDWKKWKNL